MSISFIVPLTNMRVYTTEGAEQAANEAATLVVRQNKTDSMQWVYKGGLPSTGYLLREPMYDMPWWYVTPFDCYTDAVSMRIKATTSTHGNIVQEGFAFEADGDVNRWDGSLSLLTKLGFYTAGGDAGKMKIEIGTESDFTGATQDVWKSTEVILDATLLAAFNAGTLRVEIAGRTIFRAA